MEEQTLTFTMHILPMQKATSDSLESEDQNIPEH